MFTIFPEKPRLRTAILVGKVVSSVSSLLHIGHGSTWPGEIVLQISDNFVKRIIERNPQLKVVVITGTNGKTTTTKMVTHILSARGLTVISNKSGANLLNGIASTLLQATNLSGKVDAQAAVLEVDENVLPHLIQQLQPNAIVLLNLFRDQLDRFGEINIISTKWKYALSKLDKSTVLIANGNDPEIVNLGQSLDNLSVQYFGLDKKYMTEKVVGSEADQIYCPNCFARLKFLNVAYSHIGSFVCPKCGLKPNNVFCLPKTIHPQLLGVFNLYNLTAALLATKIVWQLKVEEANVLLKGFQSAFGRQEKMTVQNKQVIVQLAKNPSSFNQAISILNDLPARKNAVLILNDRIPDGRDISWIWDVNFEPLVKSAGKIFIAGDRAYDMALRLQYQTGKKLNFTSAGQFLVAGNLFVSHNLSAVITEAVGKTASDETLVIFPTYSAMLEVRKILVGKSWH